ncbi:MAG: MFS transporter, partial [Phycisphaerae bacterium]
LLSTTRDTLRETVRIFAGLWQQPGFYRFLAFLTLAAMVRLIFVQMDYIYPKFGIRELGEGAPIGRLWGLNSLFIIVLVPVVGALSQKISAYRMVTFGSAIAAASVYILTLPPGWFQGLADGAVTRWLAGWYLGLTGAINPWYVMIFIYVVVLSLGEAIYSPRLYEYAAAIAPKGQEGTYMSMSYLPFFLAKLLIATPSGLLLARYCPAEGPRDSATLWLIIALITTVAPVGLLLLGRYIRVPEAGRND